MKKVFLHLLIFLLVVSVLTQEKYVNEDIPKITFSKIKWSHKEDWKVTGAEIYGTGDQMRPNTMTVQKRNYFQYQVSIKNDTGKNIKGFNYDLVFLKRNDGTEVGRLEFSYIRSFKKNKKMSTESSSGPPTRLVDANEADDPTKSLKVNAEIKCVMYDDETIWRRNGLAENACDELKKSVKQREDYLKGRIF